MVEDSTTPLSARQVWLAFGLALGVAAPLTLVSGDGAALPAWAPGAWLLVALLAVYGVQTDLVRLLWVGAVLAALWVAGTTAAGSLPDWALPVAVVLASLAVVALAAARGDLRAARETDGGREPGDANDPGP